jgi:hypothetical protein
MSYDELRFWILAGASGEQQVVFRYRVICASVQCVLLGIPFSGVLWIRSQSALMVGPRCRVQWECATLAGSGSRRGHLLVVCCACCSEYSPIPAAANFAQVQLREPTHVSMYEKVPMYMRASIH